MAKRENWLTLTDEKKFCGETLRRFKHRSKRIKGTKQHASVQAAWCALYRKEKNGAALEFAGPKGEMVKLTPAVFRSRVQERVALAARTPQDIEPIAKNTDAQSQDACQLGKGLIKHYQTEEHLDALFLEQYEQALACSEAYMHAPWDESKGTELGSMANAEGTGVVPAGDFDFDLPSLYDVAFATSGGQRAQRKRRDWWIVRKPMNRFAALQLPGLPQETLDAIESAPAYCDSMKEWGFDEAGRSNEDGELDDCIAVYQVYGERTAMLPDGLDALVLDETRWLKKPTPLNYARAPVFPLVPSSVMFVDEGFSNHWGGLDLAQARGGALSSILTNVKNGGIDRVFPPRKANASQPGRGSGASVIEWDHFDEDSKTLVPAPATWAVGNEPMGSEPFQAEGLLAKLQDETQGGNPVQRGDVEATKGDSGAKVAALNSVSQQVAAPDIRALFRCMRDVYNHIVSTMQRRATIERTVLIAGKANEFTATTFNNEKLRPIARIELRQPDPSRDSFEGRQVTVELVKNCKDERERQMVLSVLNTGNTDVATEDEEKSRIRIDREIEDLSDLTKPPPRARETDPHNEEIAKHVKAMNSDHVRLDDARYKRHKDHLAEHANFITPDHPSFIGLPFCSAFGVEPLPPWSMDPAADAADKQAQGGAGGKAPQQKQGAPAGDGGGELPKGGSKPGKAGMPKDPTTGQRMEGAPPPAAVTGG